MIQMIEKLVQSLINYKEELFQEVINVKPLIFKHHTIED